MTGNVQRAIVDFLKEKGGEADIDAVELAKLFSATATGVITALHSLLDKSVIKKAYETSKMSTGYILIGGISTAVRTHSARRQNNVFGGDLLQRAMEQVANLKATQEQLLGALAKNKELEKVISDKDRIIAGKDKIIAEQKEELESTDAQLLDEQRKFIDLLQSAEKNNKMITKKIEFDGRGVQRTTGV